MVDEKLTQQEIEQIIGAISDDLLRAALSEELEPANLNHEEQASLEIERLVNRQGFFHVYDLSPEQIDRFRLPNGLLRLPSDKQMFEAADTILKQWARVYQSTDLAEIERDTGAIKTKPSKLSGGIALDDPQFEQANGIVSQMVELNKSMIHVHYIKRKQIPVSRFVKQISVSRRSYDRAVRDAQYEFVVRGGLQ